MKKFAGDDFLLNTATARRLYETVAAGLPKIDYHCHLPAEEIAENKCFRNITEAWLAGDHYKWRAMRAMGVSETFITGDASDYEKFRAYCRVMPDLIGNPLYHWSHLELRRYFDCDLILNEENCDRIWALTAEKLTDGRHNIKDLILSSGVAFIGTTDDPADSLDAHRRLREEGFPVRVCPSFRPDRGLSPRKPGYADYIGKLGASAGVNITNLESLCNAYLVSLDRFEKAGCRAADHGLDEPFSFVRPDPYHADLIFKKALAGEPVTAGEESLFRTQMMRFFAAEYKKRDMVMQLHFGVLRNPNARFFRALGADSGFDIPGGENTVGRVAALLSYLSDSVGLPRTILYSINAAETEAVAALCCAFSPAEDGLPRVVQGSAWWFCDRIDGMRAQLRSFAGLSALGAFLGMTTDSRSVLSYPRHEYFRRIFCDLVGEWVENGEYPADETALFTLVRKICFENAAAYFGLQK